MDKSLQQQLYSGISRSPYSSGGRKSLLGMKKSGTGVGQSSRFSVSGRSNQSVLGVRSETHVVESYGFQMPVLVNEALTFSENSQNVSVDCSANGWAWVIHGRRLLVWQYKDIRGTGSGNSPPRKDLSRTPQRRGGVMPQCRELTLPHCDIGHKASLVSVFLSEGQQMASCVAVSPTGDVRYWPSIAHDGSSVDLTNILDGLEFDYLLEVPQQHGYIIATTTCSLVFLHLQLINGRHVLQHKTIRPSSSFLGGIGKKFASYLIGINNAQDRENKFVSIVNEKGPDGDAMISVLADRWIQRWRIANTGNTEQLLFEDGEIIQKIRDEFHHKFWTNRAVPDDVDLFLLDMHAADSKLYVLAGAAHKITAQMYYGIAVLSPTSDAMHIINFIPLKLSMFYSATTEKECLNFHFIICRSHVYLYTDKAIYPLNLSSPMMVEIDAEKIEFHLKDDKVLSAAVCGQLPLFFSRTHGLVCVTPGDFSGLEIMNAANISMDVYNPDSSLRDQVSVVNENSLFMYNLDPDAMYSEFKDEVSQLKAAFVYRLKRNINMSNMILNELLGQLEASHLDKIVVEIAEDLAEDIPAADPRWESLWDENNGNKHPLGSSSSLQILTQLKEKSAALKCFIEFLHSTGIWGRLSAVQNAGGTIQKSTWSVISDIYEKIIAAIALRSVQNKHAKALDEIINHVVTRCWKMTPHGNLTAQDMFYVHVCKFQDIFKAFVDIADTRIESQHQMNVVANFISDINSIVLHILNEVFNSREKNAALFLPPVDKVSMYEYLPWTAMSGSSGLRDEISHLIDVSVRYGARGVNEIEIKQRIYQQILELIDFILDGRKSYLNSVSDSEKYNVLQQQFESQRRDLISILIDDGQYELAAKLAEKYLDFQSLVVICDITGNQERLDGYISRYENYNFSQFAINWHLRQNRQGEVFERFKGNQAALSQFMRDHPTLGWIQLVFNGDFPRASKTLLNLALSETELVQRKKSMLSLAKLAAFSAPDSDLTEQLEKIDKELTIIEYQEQLSGPLLENFGYDLNAPKVLKVDEIIDLFICEENETANEYDFRKALELLEYIEQPDEVRHKIWCAAIMRDNWIEYDMNTAVDYLQELLFFKLIELCHLMDEDIDAILPPMENFLNSGELDDLVQNKSFQYLLKLTYEYVHDTFKKVDQSMEI